MSEAIKELPLRSTAMLPNTLNEKGEREVKEFGWPYFKAGVVAVSGGKFILVKEAKVKEKQPDGSKKWVLSDKGKWNLPCGRLQPWENFRQAADREAGEETGYGFSLGCIRHIGFRFDIDNPYIIVIYHADSPYDIDPVNPEEIAAIDVFSYDEVLALHAAGQLRNPELTLTAIHNERANVIIPDQAITVYSSKYEYD